MNFVNEVNDYIYLYRYYERMIKMKYEKSVKSLIKGRRSVRTFTDKKIEDGKTKILTSIMDELSNENYRFLIMDLDFSEGTKLGTYGVIKGASTYILGIMKKSFADDKVMASNFGYTFEQIILKSSELGLGTCWMAGTFNKKDVENLIALNDDEHIVMISPIGYEKSKSTTEKLSRFLAKSDKRKPWDQLFFIENFEKAMTPKDAGRYKDA